VVSFADPVLRRAADGRVVCPGHVGTIYQAKSATYLGRSTARTIHLLPDGTTLTARALQKVRRQEQGHSYVEKRLVAFGATVPRAGVDHRAWLEEALHAAGVRRLRHPGTHRYAFPIGPTTRARQAVRIGLPQLTYPKQIDLDT
jgi:hypothetical protein